MEAHDASAPRIRTVSGHGGRPRTVRLLPARGHAELNLLPEARFALGRFRNARIPWHHGIDDGCCNHLLSSQVQCVNALAPMAHDAGALRAFFGSALDIAEPLPVGAPEAPDDLVAFEWIGTANPLNEWKDGAGTRGANNTSADAVIKYRTSTGATEIALIEWKFVEDYSHATYDDDRFPIRWPRYAALLGAADGPIIHTFDRSALFVEPVYQLMRLQLLAHVMETRGEADAVRFVVCAPEHNYAYWNAIPERLVDALPDTAPTEHLATMWPALLHRPDRFVVRHTDVLTEPDAPTSVEYQRRYGLHR